MEFKIFMGSFVSQQCFPKFSKNTYFFTHLWHQITKKSSRCITFLFLVMKSTWEQVLTKQKQWKHHLHFKFLYKIRVCKNTDYFQFTKQFKDAQIQVINNNSNNALVSYITSMVGIYLVVYELFPDLQLSKIQSIR